jgi:pilus assembly protein CpaB
MFQRRGILLVVASLVLGSVAALAANSWVNKRLSANEEDDAKTVVVAALDIPYGTKVSGRHLRIANLPPDSIPAGAFKDVKAVEGAVATVEVSKGEVLLESRFADHESGSTLAALVSKNMRAVTVRVDDVVGVAGFLLPGNRVDVLATKTDRRSNRASAETILRDIKVLAVDQTAATENNDPIIVRAVTLELSPVQSEQLVKAKEEGKIQLTLRNPLDERVAEVQPAVVKKAPAIMTAPRRSKSPATRSSTVTVIRGTQVATKKAKS